MAAPAYINTISPEELEPLREWLSLQYSMGPEMSSEPEPWMRYFSAVFKIPNIVLNFGNLSIRSMLGILYRDLANFANADKMAIICQYYDFCKKAKFYLVPHTAVRPPLPGERELWRSHWTTFLLGFSYSYMDRFLKNVNVEYEEGIFIPILEGVYINGVLYKDELREKMESIKTHDDIRKPAPTEINIGADIFDSETPAALAKPLLDAWWGTNNVSTRLVENFAAAQRAKVTELLLLKPMTEDIYFYLLHLLIGLGTTGKGDQIMAQQIVSTTATSDEYPNDIFINQLLYMAVLHMADPNGPYKFSRDQISDMLRRTRDCIHSKDDASAAIMAAVEYQMAIVNADTSYPWTDPYNPTVDLNTRIANALAALDDARNSMSL